MKLIYVAAPIDQAQGDEVNQTTASIVWECITRGWGCYEPGRAFTVPLDAEPDSRIYKIDYGALWRCDGVIAYLSTKTPSIGTPMEIEQAASVHGKPVAVVYEGQSWALAGRPASVSLHRSVPEAASWLSVALEEYQGYVRPDQVFRWTGKGSEPQRAHTDDAGFDLVYSGESHIRIGPGESADIPARIAVEPPEHMWCLLIGRSSTFRDRGLLVNPAVIDTGYRGELFAIVRNISHMDRRVLPGERVAQLVPLPNYARGLRPVKVEQLGPTERGEAGLGSTGR